MSKKTYKLTLTRWHIVAERLRNEMTRLDAACQAKLNQAAFTLSARSTARAEAITDAARDVESMLDQHEQLNHAIEAIRIALASANASEGVSAKLATIDRLTRRMKIISTLCGIEGVKLHDFTDFMAMDAGSSPEGSVGLRLPRGQTDVIKIKVLTSERMTELEQEVDAIRRTTHSLKDETNDLNRAILALELPRHVAQVAGLETA